MSKEQGAICMPDCRSVTSCGFDLHKPLFSKLIAPKARRCEPLLTTEIRFRNMESMQTFISHNYMDKQTAREVAIFLAAENINVWFDEWKIAPGDSIIEKIEAGLKDCSHFLILWSKHASKSNWVRRELSSALIQAIQAGRVRVIPIILDDTPLPALIADYKYIRYEGGTEKDQAEIINAVAGRSPSSPFIAAMVRKYHELVRNPDAEDTLGYAVCPKCGSENIEPHEELEVEVDVGDDGEPMPYPIRFPAVRCLDCGWQKDVRDRD
jgi:hypothetical protein